VVKQKQLLKLLDSLEGEEVFQGESYELANAFGKVSQNDGWQIGPKILKL
jgi:vancomycin resistance protein YoaR